MSRSERCGPSSASLAAGFLEFSCASPKAIAFTCARSGVASVGSRAVRVFHTMDELLPFVGTCLRKTVALLNEISLVAVGDGFRLSRYAW